MTDTPNSDSPMPPRDRASGPEWGTFTLILGCYAAWGIVLFILPLVSDALAIPLLALLVALHSSLTHEVLHGHPFKSKLLNEALMFLPLNLAIPYNRFRDLHLAHHRDSNLTDPYDDPESNFLDPAVWISLPRWQRALYRINNTLAGRILIGPAIGQVLFMKEDWQLAKGGGRAIGLAWGLHALGMIPVIWIVALSPMSMGAYLVAAYLGLGLLKIRTFLEHRAHEKTRGRTVIIEDRGLLAFLFLNNNLHVVHHMHPKAAWYQLPELYRRGKDRYLACNDGYVYPSYVDIFRRYFWRAKDPVPHPLWPKG